MELPWPKASLDIPGALVWVFITLAALVVVDTVLALAFVRRTNKGHWFMLHAIANAWVVVLSVPDVWYTLRDPVMGLSPRSCDDRPLACNDVATCTIWAVHLYHILAYSKLPWDDWFHHLVFCGTIIPMHFMWSWGVWANVLSFFISGLPGGIDYFLLAMVKVGKMDPLTEKKLNVNLNMWIRSPGLVLTVVLNYVSYLYTDHDIPPYPIIIGMAVILFNGQYYAERVVGSCHVSAYKRKVDGVKPTGRRVADLFTSGNLREVECYEDVPIPVRAYEYVRGGS
eukprot:TRINITY_DN15940_c0_g5_i1.p1 TRINITY_DN15940_c0_g5~~TRINITY_DN15940_c0_g5_i1.p1  ORF type:complete len:308 (+),score=81.78 TRINITY_DN15940_c0_g5_i1:78-926(+)